jgi:hypothetical protein
MIITFTLNGIAYRDGALAGDIVRLPQSGKKKSWYRTQSDVLHFVTTFLLPKRCKWPTKKKEEEEEKEEDISMARLITLTQKIFI